MERRHSDCRFGRFGKVGRIRNLSSKNQRERSIAVTKGKRIHTGTNREERRSQWSEEISLPCGKIMKNVDLDEPSSYLDHVYLGCIQRERTPNEFFIEEFSKMFESHISAGATEKLPGWEKPHAKTVAWSHDMEGHARKCIER